MYTLANIFDSIERYRLFVIYCKPGDLDASIDFLKSNNINVKNVGKDLAAYVNSIEDYAYLHIDVYDYLKKYLELNKSSINNKSVLAIYNLGIFLEPRLELNAVQLLKEFSKSTSLIIIWENECEENSRLYWSTQQHNISLDFTETPLKKLQYAI
jgi:hypothetical protein